MDGGTRLAAGLGHQGYRDHEKKAVGSKQDQFVREAQTLIDKFRGRKEEAERRKAEKQETLHGRIEEEEQAEKIFGVEGDVDSIDYSDVDASAARRWYRKAIFRKP